jgi:hypothetical protein
MTISSAMHGSFSGFWFVPGAVTFAMIGAGDPKRAEKENLSEKAPMTKCQG